MRRRWHRGWWPAAVIVAFLLPACDPLAVPRDPHVAELSLDVGGSGDATLDVLLGGDRGQALLRTLPNGVTSAAFPTASSVDVVIDENDGGWAFGVVRARDTYPPGPAPSFGFDTRSAVSALRALGYTDVQVTACVPRVPKTLDVVPPGERISESCVQWDVIADEEAPRIHLRMRPEPVWGWLIVGSDVIILGAGAAGWLGRIRARRRKASGRAVSIVGGAITLATFVFLVTVPAEHGIDNLTVSGTVAPTPFAVAGAVMGIGSFIGVLLGLSVIVAAIVDGAPVSSRQGLDLPPPPPQ
jgi:hypothetical protein